MPQPLLSTTIHLQALYDWCLLEQEADASFDRLSLLASTLLDAPVSLVSLIYDDQQYFKSKIGIPEPMASTQSIPLKDSYSKEVITSAQPLIINDTETYPKTFDNPEIVSLNTRAYLGVPLKTADGYAVGTVSVLDSKPRQWTPAETELLESLANSLMVEIEIQIKDLLSEQMGRRVSTDEIFEELELGQFRAYEAMAEIGAGGWSVVYRCKHKILGTTVAIKQLKEDCVINSTYYRRFSREAEIASQLKHPNIIRVFSYNVDTHDQPYIVMEYIKGTDLSEHLHEHGALPLPDVLAIADQLADALDYAHRMDVIHRDIKASNVMLREINTQDGKTHYHATLMDFGIAKMRGNISELSVEGLIGTIAYASPEQFQDAREVDHLSDLYSFGVLLFEMITGTLPFSTSYSSIMRGHLARAVPNILELNPDLPSEFNYVMQRAMAKNPDDRYQSARELVDALRACL